MGSLKSYLAACLLLISQTLPACASETALPDLSRLFAECAGRYSALTEYLWLWDGPASEEAARRRDQFITLTAATLPDASDPVAAQALSYRIEAKVAHRALLDRNAYSRSPAKPLSKMTQTPQCDRLLLTQ